MGVYIEAEKKPKENIWSVEVIYHIEEDGSLLSIAETVEPSQVIEIDLVRCKECKYHAEDGWGYGNCERPFVYYLRTAQYDFCPYGERRADGHI